MEGRNGPRRQARLHPALLFWEFQDEPILNKVSLEGSRKGYQLVKREDPDHPMLVIEWPGAVSRMQTWKGIGDIFGTDLYPIPRERKYGALANHDITQMRDYIEALRKAHGDKPILLVLQAWAWDPLKDGEKGYPTVQESRFMAYQAVIHGAKGLHYYGQVHCSQPNSAAALYSEAKDPATRKAEFEKCRQLNELFWKAYRPFFGELARASVIFVMRDAKPSERVQRSSGGPNVEIRTKESDGQLYILAVNADTREGEVTLQLPKGRTVDQMHVLFEQRKIAVKDGSFADNFKPYDTHVYATVADVPR